MNGVAKAFGLLGMMLGLFVITVLITVTVIVGLTLWSLLLDVPVVFVAGWMVMAFLIGTLTSMLAKGRDTMLSGEKLLTVGITVFAFSVYGLLTVLVMRFTSQQVELLKGAFAINVMCMALTAYLTGIEAYSPRVVKATHR